MRAMRRALTVPIMLASAIWAGQAWAQPESEIHQDWAVRCIEREALPPCDMVQFATQDDSGEPVMQFSIAHAGDKASYGIQIVVPLGVRLPAGVVVRVDNAQPLEGFAFTRCEVTGCFIERIVAIDVLEPFKAGNAGVLAVVDRAGEPLVIPLSFKGFTKALEVMTERNRTWANAQ